MKMRCTLGKRTILLFIAFLLSQNYIQAQETRSFFYFDIRNFANEEKINFFIDKSVFESIEGNAIPVEIKGFERIGETLFRDTLQLNKNNFEQFSNYYTTTTNFKNQFRISYNLSAKILIEAFSSYSFQFSYTPTTKLDFSINIIDKDKNRASYIKRGSSVSLEGNNSFYMYQFPELFDPAAPPMIPYPIVSTKAMIPDTLIRFSEKDTITLEKEALVFIQTDTTTRKGLGLFISDYDFPKIQNVDRLLETMVYIFTPTEIETYLNTTIEKKAFENFWLNAGGTMKRARSLIRLYFQRVTFANQFYTTYKPGWKTDKGMIHIVFGNPYQIFAEGETETWVYNTLNSKTVKFQFRKKGNIFSKDHYELMRLPNYKKPWYEAVRSWRLGKLEILNR